MTKTKALADVTVSNEGTVFLFRANTQFGKEWIDDNVPAEATYFADGLVVEHRYARDLADGMRGDGLVLE